MRQHSFKSIMGFSFMTGLCVSLWATCCTPVQPAKLPQPPPDASEVSSATPQVSMCEGPVCHAPKQSLSVVEGKTWKMPIPQGWAVTSPKSDSNRVLKIERELKDPDNTVVLVILTMPWSNKDEEAFASNAAAVFLDRPDIDVLTAEEVDVMGHSGLVVIFTAPTNGVVMLQLSVASGGVGHIVRCGGAAANVEKVVTSCIDTIKDFELKKTRPAGTYL